MNGYTYSQGFPLPVKNRGVNKNPGEHADNEVCSMLNNDKVVLNLFALKCPLKFYFILFISPLYQDLLYVYFLHCVPFWKGIKVYLLSDVFSVCMCAFFSALEQLISFHNTVLDHHMIGGHSSPINFNFLQPVMTKWQIGKL